MADLASTHAAKHTQNPAKVRTMPTPSPKHAHLRTRRDHASETAEDYVEAVADVIQAHGECRVMHLVDLFGVSHVTVSRTVGRLAREGLLSTSPRQPIELTAKGRRLARDCKARHDIVYRFLLAIGVSERAAAIDSEGIEHHLSSETLDRLRDIADNPPANPLDPST